MQINKRTRILLQVQKYIFIILLLCAAGMLAWLSTKHSSQFDWTANARNSLSKSSVALLKTLKDPVVVNVYVKNNPSISKAVTEILDRYQRVKSNFTFHLINPDIDIQQAQRDKVTATGQIIIEYEGRKETLGSLSEEKISSALLRLSRGSARKVVFLTGHGERDPDIKDNRNYSKLAAELTSKGFKIEKLSLLEKPIPDDTRVLVIASPVHELLKGEVERISKYIDNGGNLLWLADPGKLYGLGSLAKKLGVVFQPGVVVDDNINLRATLQIQQPTVIPVLEYFPHPVTKGINYNTLFPLVRGVGFASREDKVWKHEPLFRSFQKSWTETGDINKKIVFNTADGDIAGPITLGVALERQLHPDKDKTSGKSSQRIVVVGDSDFLSNAFIGAGANLSLGMNMFNWLVGDDNLIAVEPKSAPDTHLRLNDNERIAISAGFFFIVPGLLLVVGFGLWFKRRKR
jgi:ABC-type uncharacterized transport system involved in gliding motility auxiliary subunit